MEADLKLMLKRLPWGANLVRSEGSEAGCREGMGHAVGFSEPGVCLAACAQMALWKPARKQQKTPEMPSTVYGCSLPPNPWNINLAHFGTRPEG